MIQKLIFMITYKWINDMSTHICIHVVYRCMFSSAILLLKRVSRSRELSYKVVRGFYMVTRPGIHGREQ